ncbi:MAG: hypothetical protein WC307_02900 [Candidatus Nanoarchaeia archaeon]|jgi:hypothetical protein
MPVYETFTARARELNWIETNNHYRYIQPGNQTIEVLTINDGNGTVIARTNIQVLNFESIMRDECSYLMSEPLVDADGWSREGKIGKCVSNIAVEYRKVNVCDTLFRVFNDTGAGYGDCLINYAVNTGDVSACELASMPKSRGFCKAKVTGDWAECREITCDISCAMEGLEVQQDLCIQWYAIENNNASLCNEIKSDAYNMKEICYNMTSSK